MIIQCSKCKTSFNVDQNLISKNTKVFHCSVCKHEWAIEFDSGYSVIKDEKTKNVLETIQIEIQRKKHTFEKTSDQILSEIDDSRERDIDDILEIPAFLRR